NQGNAGNFPSLPKVIEDPQGVRCRVWLGEAEQLQIARLKDKRERLGKGVVGNAGQERVVHVVEREDLFHIVAKLVDGNVVALVVHAVLFDPGSQMWKVAASLRLQRVSGPPGGIDDNVRSQILGAALGEAEFLENIWNVGRECLGGRILLLR